MGYRMVLLLGLAIGINAALFSSATGQDGVALDFFPGTKVFPRFTADALQHTISLAKVTENREWMGTIGTEVPIIEITAGNSIVQAGLGVSTFNGLIRPPGHLTVYTHRLPGGFSARCPFWGIGVPHGAGAHQLPFCRRWN